MSEDDIDGVVLVGKPYSYFRSRLDEQVVIGRFDDRLIAFKDVQAYGRYWRSRNGA